MTRTERRTESRSSIATKLLRVVFALYIVIAAVVTIGHMVMEYRYQKNAISKDLENIQQTFEKVLALEIWGMNEASLLSTVKGMLKVPAVVGVEIHNEKGVDIAVGGYIRHLDGNDTGLANIMVDLSGLTDSESAIGKDESYKYEVFKHSFPIIYTYQNNRQVLGEAFLFSDSSVILRRVKLGFLLLIVTTVFKITVLWFIFLWVFKSILKRPLSILTEAAEKVDLEDLEDAKVDIKRTGNDELTHLAASFNNMITNLQASLADRKLAEEALSQSELRFRDFFENAPIGFHIFGFDQIITDINDAELKMIGYRRDEIVNKKTLSDLIIPEQQEQFKEHWQDIKVKGYVKDLEYTLVHKDGSRINVILNASSRYDEDGELVSTRGSMLNITDRKKAENEILAKSDQLRASNQQLVSSEQQLKASNMQLVANEQQREKLLRTLEVKNEELQSIVYIVSHDLKSPLVNISGFSAMLNESCQEIIEIMKGLDISDEVMDRIIPLTDENIPESLKFISASVGKMKMLLDGLLQVSHIGTQEIDIQTLDMNKMIKHITDTHAFQIGERKVSLVVGGLPDCQGDEKQINQVFSNLFGNAIKYLDPKRKGSIKISGEVHGEECVYCIEDNGIGIHQDHQHKIFQLFHRLNPDDSTEGQGLGLTITRRALTRNGGWTWMESESGKGSKFFVSLPRE